MYKPKGVEMPPEEVIRHLFKRNPDGAGFAIQGDIRGDGHFGVFYQKGFMTADMLLDALRSLPDLKSFTVAVHCRKKTSGKIDPATCHPFPICRQYTAMKQLKGEGAVLFHNGEFQGLGGLLHPNASDTEDYVAGVATHYLAQPYQMNSPERKIIQKLTGKSRILILYPDQVHPVLKLGKWHQRKGCFYSKKIYKRF